MREYHVKKFLALGGVGLVGVIGLVFFVLIDSNQKLKEQLDRQQDHHTSDWRSWNEQLQVVTAERDLMVKQCAEAIDLAGQLGKELAKAASRKCEHVCKSCECKPKLVALPPILPPPVCKGCSNPKAK